MELYPDVQPESKGKNGTQEIEIENQKSDSILPHHAFPLFFF